MSHKGCVYFICGEKTNLIKIGFSNNLTTRLTALKLASPVPLILIGAIPTSVGHSQELSAHAVFHEYRKHGEWFEISEETAVAYILMQGGKVTENAVVFDTTRPPRCEFKPELLDTLPNLMATGDAARVLGVTSETVRRWLRKKLLSYVEVGPHRLKRIQREDLKKFVMSVDLLKLGVPLTEVSEQLFAE